MLEYIGDLLTLKPRSSFELPCRIYLSLQTHYNKPSYSVKSIHHEVEVVLSVPLVASAKPRRFINKCKSDSVFATLCTVYTKKCQE